MEMEMEMEGSGKSHTVKEKGREHLGTFPKFENLRSHEDATFQTPPKIRASRKSERPENLTRTRRSENVCVSKFQDVINPSVPENVKETTKGTFRDLTPNFGNPENLPSQGIEKVQFNFIKLFIG